MPSFVEEDNLFTLLLFTHSQTALYWISLLCSPCVRRLSIAPSSIR